jgi:predicted AAA+ superfamily ATPase
VNYSSLSKALRHDDKTIKSHVDALEQLMLVRRHSAWFGNLSKRQVKAPKLYLTDTGLWAHLIGADRDALTTTPTFSGQACENFVAMEIVKQLEWSSARAEVFHFRDRDQREVDIVLERRDGAIIGIEVKSASSVSAGDFKSLRHLRDLAGDRFVQGIVMYTGADTVQFEPGMTAVPICGLWSSSQ